MEEISHFSHEHPLIILKQVPTGLIDGQKIECYGCRKPLSEGNSDLNLYGCELCKSFFLHKSCAQLPKEIIHKSHEQHSLFLIAKQPARYLVPAFCDVCKDYMNGFFYHCDLCQFDLDIKCAFSNKDTELVDVKKDVILNHLDHEHPLTLLPWPANFHCNACDVKAEDYSYHCAPCDYWIHRRCALLPSTTTRKDHKHLLSLCFRLPSEYHSFKFICDGCEKEVHKDGSFWLYYCNLCRYFVHIKCMATYKPLQADFEIGENLIRLPATTDITVELIQRFLLKVDSLPELEAEIQIFSHNHPLKLSSKKFTEDEIDDNDDEEILCDACILPITTSLDSLPYYCCAECKYFLHLLCAKLPSSRKFIYLNHLHTLILGCKMRIYDTFCCGRCKDISNGFYFSCEAEGCEFFLDVKCAALPFIIMHETHGHPLLTIMDWNSRICNGCERDIRPFEALFRCKYCQFYLHLGCAMLPRKVLHRYDSKHSLILKFPPHEYHGRPFDCFKCQKEINPRYWLYHCEESDLSLHTYCVPRLDIFPGVKCGQRIQISYHPHPLQHVRRAAVNGSICHHCRRDMTKFTAFQCETCNFRFCQECVLAIDETQDSVSSQE